MRLVKWLFGLAVLATALWCLYWFTASQTLRVALAEVLAQPDLPLRTQGYSVRGFPNRFDVTLDEPRLDLPEFGWSAPFVQVFALSYRPHHVIAVFPPVQEGHLGGLEWRLAASDARASALGAPTRNLELERSVAVIEGADLTAGGTRWRMEALRLAIRRTAAGSYEAVAEAEAVFPDPAMMDEADPQAIWPRRIAVMRVDLALDFARPLDLDLARGAALPPPAVALTGARLAWDGADLHLTGRVDLGAPEGPAGDLVLAVTGWADVVDRLARAGILTAEQRAWVDGMAPGLTRSGDAQAVDIPLRVEAGQVRLGSMVLLDFGVRPAPAPGG